MAWSPAAAGCCGCRSASRMPSRWSSRSPVTTCPRSGPTNSAWSAHWPNPAARWTPRSRWRKITANGPLAVAATKKIIVQSRYWGDEEQWTEQMKILGPVFMSKDAQEGAVAFAEKRAPHWTGT